MGSFLDTWLEKKNRIIVFAGVFDPVHIGHISAAREAMWYGSKVIFLPERVPQHKHGTAAYKHRLAMLEVALSSEPNTEVIDYPEDHQYIEPTFTWLQHQFPNRTFMWLVGGDVLEHISSWKDSDRLGEFSVAGIVTLPRSEDSFVKYRPNKIHDTTVYYRSRVMRKRSHQSINSTVIRQDMESKHTSLPDGVHDYIKQHSLYTKD